MFLAGFLVFAFFKDELEARKSLKASFTARMITKYSLQRVFSICGEKKKCLASMSRYLSPRYGYVILVSGYLVLTAVN